ncbi:unnamed protein product [Prorocentrum cordatum]|uniref:C3H1-type domain-containing protein n=1 Tax=Prorocentrum cordatum TaxID=2364126 RepID=A0ABN9R7N0_9DINO|nr:unnamed protein product [Polarella glacialis]
MCGGRGNSMQVSRQADATRLGLGPGPGRNSSDGSLGGATGGRLPLVDATGMPAQLDDDQGGSAGGSAASHGSVSERAPSEVGSHCSSSDPSDSRWGLSDCSECENSGSSASGSSHSESHGSLLAGESEVVEQQDAEWLKGNEAQHAAGTCRPCLYHKTKAGCANGRACRYCHLPHAAKRRARPREADGVRCKQLVAKLDSRGEGDVDAVSDLVHACGLSRWHMRSVCRARHQQQGPPGAEPGGPAEAAAGETPQQRLSRG